MEFDAILFDILRKRNSFFSIENLLHMVSVAPIDTIFQLHDISLPEKQVYI